MGHLFKSRKQRQKEERRERRRAFRQAENAVDVVKDRIRQMEREAKKQWEQAREAMKSGENATAQRLLTGYRAAQVLMMKMEQKRWVFEQYLMKMETAQSDNEFAQALEGVNQVIQIDPERVADVFEASQDVLGEKVDADRFWDRLYAKEMDGATGDLEDHVPGLDEMMQQLEGETAAEVGDGVATRVSGELDERIANGQERVKKLLDDSK